LSVGQILLAAILIIAAFAKLASLSRTRQSLEGFGVPAEWVVPASWALPVAELLSGFFLLLPTTAWWGAVAAFLLFSVFNAVIAYNLALGRTPECNCFGQLHSTPVGRSTLARNLGFTLAAAAIVLLRSPTGSGTWSVEANLVVLVGSLAALSVIAILWLLVQSLKRLEEMQEFLAADPSRVPPVRDDAALPVQNLPIGAPAPDFDLESIDRLRVSLRDLLEAGRPVLLFFMSADCGPCTALLPEMEQWHQEHGHRAVFAIITRGNAAANRTKFRKVGLKPVLLQEESTVALDYFAKWTPAAILIKGDGSIGSQVAFGDREIRSLIEHFTESTTVSPWFATSIASGNGHKGHPQDTQKLKIGDPAPSLVLPDLDGRETELASFLGRKTIVLFWRPDCSFCQNILADLQEWEKQRNDQSPHLLIVSAGEREAHADMNLQSPILLIKDAAKVLEFGAMGTPSAILIDEDGKVASVMGRGTEAVLAIAGIRPSRTTQPAEDATPGGK
jgi:peroxiredoxin/uncharacterized membrane protein YphA (DoxX/SURF4 family)